MAFVESYDIGRTHSPNELGPSWTGMQEMQLRGTWDKAMALRPIPCPGKIQRKNNHKILQYTYICINISICIYVCIHVCACEYMYINIYGTFSLVKMFKSGPPKRSTQNIKDCMWARVTCLLVRGFLAIFCMLYVPFLSLLCAGFSMCHVWVVVCVMCEI